MRSRRKLEGIAGRVNADGSIAAGDGFTVTRNSIGNYTIALSPGFRLVSATANASVYNSAFFMLVLDSFTASSFRVLFYNSAGGQNFEGPFTFHADGIQT